MALNPNIRSVYRLNHKIKVIWRSNWGNSTKKFEKFPVCTFEDAKSESGSCVDYTFNTSILPWYDFQIIFSRNKPNIISDWKISKRCTRIFSVFSIKFSQLILKFKWSCLWHSKQPPDFNLASKITYRPIYRVRKIW